MVEGEMVEGGERREEREWRSDLIQRWIGLDSGDYQMGE